MPKAKIKKAKKKLTGRKGKVSKISMLPVDPIPYPKGILARTKKKKKKTTAKRAKRRETERCQRRAHGSSCRLGAKSSCEPCKRFRERILKGEREVKDPTFSVICADPDWMYQNFGAAKHGAARSRYDGTVGDVIGQIPVGRWARKDSILFMWCPCPKLDVGFEVLKQWGAKFITSIPWVKTNPRGAAKLVAALEAGKEPEEILREIAKGIGFWTYLPAEMLIVARFGNAKAPIQAYEDKPDGLFIGDRAMGAVFWAPKSPSGAHSRKPLSMVEWIEATLPGPRLELYATGKRPGWTTWGRATGQWLCDQGVLEFDEAKALGLVPEDKKK